MKKWIRNWIKRKFDLHDTEDLIGRESRVGKSYFSLQFMLDTTLSDGLRYPLKTKDLIVQYWPLMP